MHERKKVIRVVVGNRVDIQADVTVANSNGLTKFRTVVDSARVGGKLHQAFPPFSIASVRV